MFRLLVLFFVLIIMMTSTVQGQELVDLTDFARITASGTRNTFFGLWPKETDDAPYTVRDGDPDTSWKIPEHGETSIIFDFAPLIKRPPGILILNALWKTIPENTITVRVLDACGGTVLDEQKWLAPFENIEFLPPQFGFCVELVLNEPGLAALAEMQIYAKSLSKTPSFDGVEITQQGNTLTIQFLNPNRSVNHFEIHYLKNEYDPVTKETLVEVALPYRPWKGPSPRDANLKAIIVPIGPGGSIGESVVADLPSQQVAPLVKSGVVEGFYGRPWSFSERRAMVLRMAQIGLGLYIYGPKNDPLHRDYWREQYDADAIARFIELKNLGDILGVVMSFGISPGRDMDLESPEDRQALLDKLTPFIDGGYRHITLLMDDIGSDLQVPVDGDLGARHSDFANWLRDELIEMAEENVTVWFVPTVYADSWEELYPEGTEYLEALVALHSDIEVMWTGTKTFSQSLEAANIAHVTAKIGKKPAIWDNEHATDGSDFLVGKVCLAPYENRSPDLVGAVAGILANPMILGSADRLIIGTYADYLMDPYGYDAETSLEEACKQEGANADDEELALWFAQTFHGSSAYGIPGINLPENPMMDEAIDVFEQAVANDDFDKIINDGAKLLKVAAKMVVAQSLMHHSGIDVSLVDDLWVPSDRLLHEGRTLLYLLHWTGTNYEGAPNPDSWKTADELIDEALLDRYQLSLLKVILFKSFLGKQDYTPNDFLAPQIADPPGGLIQGEQWEYEASDSATINIFGLAGAVVSQGKVEWTPEHAGIYHAVVIAQSESGWSWKEFTLYVSVPPEEPDDDDEDDDNDDNDDEDLGPKDDESEGRNNACCAD